MADSSKDIQLRELTDMINDLRKMIKTLQATVDAANKREATLTQERDNLKEEVDLLRKKLFGSSSEKRTLDIPGQVNFFKDAEVEHDPVLAQMEEQDASLPENPTKKRKPRATDAERFKGIPVEKKYLDLSESEKTCPVCGTALKQIGEEFVRRELVFIPAKLKVCEYYSRSYECPQCSRHGIPVIKKGKDGRPHLLYGLASAGTVSWVMYQKFCNALPYFRQEKDWKQYGASITRATMANWVIQNSEAFFSPMYEYFHRKLLEQEFAMADETPLQVLHEPGKKPQSDSYLWLYRTGGDTDKPIVLYEYQPGRGAKHPKEFLDGFHGYLHADGYAGYHSLPEEITVVGCWAHLHRKFDEAVKSLPKGKANGSSAAQGLAYCNLLFAIEQELSEKKVTEKERYHERLKQAKPVLDATFAWANSRTAAPKSALGKALNYLKEQWPYLTNYLKDGRLEIPNNRAERSIKPFVIDRKNFLFANTPKGATGSAVMFSMIQTAIENGLDPCRYLTWLLKTANNADLNDRQTVQALLPWNASIECRSSASK